MSRQSLWVGTNIADRYCITGEIGGGGMGRVYSAIPFSDPSQTVAIKVIERTRLDYEDVLRFQREAALMSRLRHPNIIAFHELGLYKPRGSDGAAVVSGYYIVMEVAQGHDLKESLSKGGRKRLDFFFELGLQVSAALEYTHAKNIIHRDIKPQNIIIERSNDSEGGLLVKVLDFGIARLTELDLYSDKDTPLDVAGTPLYMAPETSKFLDAPVDHRVDLYSLGCVLYEVLAGKPPFGGNTREKLAREHAQATPEPLTFIRPDVPDVVNDIVMKLMAKNPKDRYQTAFGLHVDLQRVKKMLQSTRGRSQRFILGRYDRLNILPSTVPMVGRQADFESLVSNYSVIAKDTSRSRLVVVRGAGGTGKTRLLKEFRGYLAQHKIRYISTSFSRHENNLPFNALANAFNEYLVHVFRTQPIEAEEIRRKVKTLLGPTASLVSQIVQGLKPYLTPESPDSDTQALHNDMELGREVDTADFAKAFSDFTRCLAAESEPVAFFFDDMHWADDQSLELIDRFLSHNNSQRFLLIITYRSVSAQTGQGFQNFLTKFSKLRRRFHEIELGPLSAPASNELSRTILNLSRGPDPSFATYIQEKTQGNPLYLLELHRSLVFQELLSLDDHGRWRIELDEIRQTDLSSNSIDLLLNRLIEMVDVDLRILEIAAIIGVQFTSDILQALPDTDPLRISRVLGRAMTSGLVVLSPDQGRSATTGRAYSFTHRSIREALVDGMAFPLRCEVHRLVAVRIEGSGNLSRAQVIFNLAHHFYHASKAFGAADPMLVEKALDYNIKAGMKALEIDSKLTAQRYFENARTMLPLLDPQSSLVNSSQKQLYHALADIHFAQREYGEAVKLYQDLRKMKLSSVEYAFVTYKLTHLNLVSGNVAATLRELSNSFIVLQFPPVLMNTGSYLRVIWLFATSVLLPISRSAPVRALRHAEATRPGKSSFHPLSLYLIGQSAGFNFDKRLAMVYHTALVMQALRSRLPEDLLLRLLSDHAIFLSYLGFQKRAYMFLEIVFAIAKKRDARSILGYATFQQTLIIDQYQGKLEDIRFSLDLVQANLQGQEFQLQAMQERIFRIVTFLFCGKGKDLTRLFQTLPSLLTVRHWLTTKAVGMYLFWLMLTDSRELIVSYGSFVKKRSKDRRPDAFTKIIEAIVSLAAGERENSKSAYYHVLGNFKDGLEAPWLLPYEIDFILIFLGVFPEAYSAEYGVDLLSDQRLRPTLKKILSITSHRRHHRRAVPILLRARITEILGEKKVKLYFDIALKRSKITQQPLIEMITRIWFGRHLSEERAMLRIDYFDMADELARKMKLDMITALLRKIRRNFGQVVDPTLQISEVNLLELRKNSLDPMLQQHLQLLPRLRPAEVDIEVAKAHVFELLRQRLQFESVHLLTVRDILDFAEAARPPTTKVQEIIAYISPYMSLRSSLTIPVGDAPWMQGLSRPFRPTNRTSPVLDAGTEEATAFGFDEEGLSVEKTMVLPLPEVLPPVASSEKDDILLQRSMNTLVPIRYAEHNLGMLFLEASRIQDEDSTVLRQTLDSMGAQVGMWLRAYLPLESRPEQYPFLSYSPGSYQLEPCSWLHLWSEGNLRNGRESVWYLGLNLSANAYLLTYCRINGAEELCHPLSSLLWHEVLSLRTLFTGGGADYMTPEDLQDAIEKQLNAYDLVGNLEGITISFSLINRQTGDVWSGHFGQARPLLLGSENQVTPLNRAILTFANDRSLRYWKVLASPFQKGVYILPHDSSKLDRLNIGNLMATGFDSLGWDQKRWAFLDFLRSNLAEGQVPRYFVAASSVSSLTSSTSPILERAG